MKVLDQILSRKSEEIQKIKAEDTSISLRSRAMKTPPARDFIGALRDCRQVPIIAEIKRMSPSGGALREVDDIGAFARAYESAGASALSVLTDTPFFGGSLDDLKKARNSSKLPILRKDFILDPVQLYQSRLARADAVLLIATLLKPSLLSALFKEAVALGMTPVIEIHDESELAPALELNPPIVGINNRNLDTMQVDLETCRRLRHLVPPSILVIGESGIKGPEDVTSLRSAGLDAFLVGTTLMKSADPSEMLGRLCRAGA
jgi:indole-3-glycerol phosphate synthase